ncbi:MAG: TIGR03619 family F420-dependent LLM class oxidoreductase [Myxococcota bacterium]|nr:TIGR03619 family F420-dependent LLM class oxidoreductase [Myxococcota bacterium]
MVISDHVIHPVHLGTPYPYTADGKPRWAPETPWPDPLVAVGAMAAVTRSIRFITSVLVLPLRHPVLAAKSVATASVLSQGRLTLGVGAGWMREEFEVLGQSFEGRGRRLAESIEIMRTLFSGGAVEHHGEFYDFGPLQMNPVPPQPVPIYGGGVSDAALRRAATLCDGWASEIQTREELDTIMDRLRTYRAQSDRAGEPLGICAALRDVYDLDGYREMRDRGVTELITVPWLFYGDANQSREARCDGIKRFGDEVLDHF